MSELTIYEQPNSNVAIYRASTDAAALCKEIVVQTAMEIQGRKYVRVEGWQAIALAHGCVASAHSVERCEGGFRAIGEVRRMSDGASIGQGEGFVGEDETTWFGGTVTSKWGKKELPKRPDYAIRAMAQTRAISRACRGAFAHVVVMMNAGLSTTPAEEVPEGGGHDSHDRPEPRKTATEKAEAVPEEFDAAAAGLDVESDLKACIGKDKKALQDAWEATKGLRMRIKKAAPHVHKLLEERAAEIAKSFEQAPAAVVSDDMLDDNVPY